MLVYITYNDLPSGIYSSQVIDVVKFINEKNITSTKLVAFISLRGFLSNRAKIRMELPSALVIPMFPGTKNWRKNSFLLKLVLYFFKPQWVIGRSVQATLIAERALNKGAKLIYDGRGAIAAEWNEYNVVEDKEMKYKIHSWESQALAVADFRIAVSQKLVEHWQEVFNYNKQLHAVIPCTLNEIFLKKVSDQKVEEVRRQLGYDLNHQVFVFSGSLAGWQSIEWLRPMIQEILGANGNNRVLFLSNTNKTISELIHDFPGLIACVRVNVNEVPAYLSVCQFGLLIRENSITNKVASPVKFAEYLACGLNVIISENLGDYSEFVMNNQCGEVYIHGKKLTFTSQSKVFNRSLAIQHFSKESYLTTYKSIIR